MTITEILTEAATYHHLTLADLTIAGQNVGLTALNRARKRAELLHDFNFNRKVLTLAVDTVTGGSLENAVLQGTTTTAEIKTVVDIGTFDDDSNFVPQEWTTTEEGYEREREENRYRGIRYPSDGEVLGAPWGGRRLTLSNNNLAFWPKADVAETVTVGIDAHVFTPDYTDVVSVGVQGTTGVTAFNTTYYRNGTLKNKAMWINVHPVTGVIVAADTVARVLWYSGNTWVMSTANDLGTLTTGNFATSAVSTADTPAGLTLTPAGTLTGVPIVTAITGTLTSASDIWLTHGFEYLLWTVVDSLNRYFKTYIPRQEGNLSSPIDLAQAGLAALLEWDNFKYEAFRRHGRA